MYSYLSRSPKPDYFPELIIKKKHLEQVMDEGMPRLQERQLHRAHFLGVDYSSLYMCKSKRGMKRDESKEAYKLPHRLIEKKRRDRINECIAQLKDLLPEHLKLTTLGHLEKAVVLELTLKHLKSLTAASEQQHQKIIALQNGDRSMKSSIQTDLDAFHSGFQTCAKEVLQYLNRFENWTPREQRCAQLISHLHKVSAQLLPSAQLLSQQISAHVQDHSSQKLETQTNCVPVIQRTHNGELNENDTDTDSGYGGEAEKCEGKHNNKYNSGKPQGLKNVRVKQEFGEDHPAKKIKMESSGTASVNPDPASRPDMSLINSLVGLGGVPFGQQTPFCLPFYFISPSAAATYMPFLDKANLEKYFYPAAAATAAAAATSPFPLMYPRIPAQTAAAAAAVFPGLSASLTPDKVCASSAMLSQKVVSSPSPSFESAMGAGSSSSAKHELNVDSESPPESDNDET